MELEELQSHLGPFARAKLDDPAAAVSNVHKMPGHAGFSYGFSTLSRDIARDWYLRLPPPNVQWKGTADVLRQVEVLNALDATDVPHCSVTWSGDDLEWFGRPYFVVPKLDGDTARTGPDSWVAQLPPETRREMARQTMRALAGVHKVDWQRATPYLGAPIPFDSDVTRWDTFYERAAEPQMLARAPEVKAALLAQLPSGAPLGVFHGDFQWGNVFFSREGKLLAIIDWELTGVGSTLNDVGWIATFSDPTAWPTGGGNGILPGANPLFPGADELIAMYAEAWGRPLPNPNPYRRRLSSKSLIEDPAGTPSEALPDPDPYRRRLSSKSLIEDPAGSPSEELPDLNWFRALAAYKFAIITGFNLNLHRRGKRHDPMWEDMAPCMETLLWKAVELLE